MYVAQAGLEPIILLRQFVAGITDVCTTLGSKVYNLLSAELTLTFQRPYIVYMLQDLDILEDWTTIRKV